VLASTWPRKIGKGQSVPLTDRGGQEFHLALITPKTVVEVLWRSGLSPLRILSLLSSAVSITTSTRRSSVSHRLRSVAGRRLSLWGGKASLLGTVLA
jgi:hypothetical protein